MKKAIPKPIMSNIIKIALCCTAMLACGIIFSSVSGDSILLFLSIAVFFLGALRALSLWKQAKKGDYAILEGTLTNLEKLKLQNRTIVSFTLPDGT